MFECKVNTVNLLKRYPGNPIVSPKDIPYPAKTAYNAGAIKHDGKYILLIRTELDIQDDRTVVVLARSDDGINFEIDDTPILAPSGCDDGVRIYDPRITKIDNKFYVLHALTSPWGIRLAILESDDLKTFKRVYTSLPDNRNGVLFPEKIGGMFVRLERPMPLYNPHYTYSTMNIWFSESPDMEFWGRHRIVLEAKHIPWAQHKIGPACPPIKTHKGWLTFIHGVEMTDDQRKIYRLGCILLDLDDPSKVVAMIEEPVLEPQCEFEKIGFVNDVVFLCGAIPEDDGEIKVYYAGADQYTCLATAYTDQLLDACVPVKFS